MAISDASYHLFFALVGVTDLIGVRCLFFIYIFVFKTGHRCRELGGVEEQSWTNEPTVRSNQRLLLDESISRWNDVKWEMRKLILSRASEVAFTNTGKGGL